VIADLAGPVEFSTADLLWLLLAGTLALFGLPLIGAAFTYFRYKKRAAENPDGPSPSPIGRAAIVFVIVLAAQTADDVGLVLVRRYAVGTN
jgi:xanthine/uracil permease